MGAEFKRISVVGLGYIGLPTAAVIASRGIDVIGVDVSQHVVGTINEGKIHIVEPDLDMVVQAAVKTGHLRATLDPEPADAFMIAVPTPFKGDHVPDLSYIESATKAIAPVLKKGNLVVLESTSPVGATEQVAKWIAEARGDLRVAGIHDGGADIYVAHCPERVLPGKVLHELVENDRTIGGNTPECAERAKDLYSIFVRGELLITDSRTAELVKLTENAFRDVNIAFANELSLIADRLKINVWELIQLANRHPRVNILQPGPGVGGHCIAIDPWFIVDSAPEQARLVRTAREVNDSKPGWVVGQVMAATEVRPATKIACLGLAFKPNIDDLRESPALSIAKELVGKFGERVIPVEPHIDELPASLSGAAPLADAETAIAESDIVVLLVDHDAFKELRRDRLDGKTVIDTRGLFERLDIRN